MKKTRTISLADLKHKSWRYVIKGYRIQYKDKTKAEQYYKKAIKIYPRGAGYYHLAELKWHEYNDYKSAIEYFGKVIKFDREFKGNGYRFRAQCKLFINEYKGAIEDYMNAIKCKIKMKKEIDKESLNKYYQIINNYKKQEIKKGNIKNIGNKIFNYYSKCLGFTNLDKYKRAISYLTKLARLYPKVMYEIKIEKNVLDRLS